MRSNTADLTCYEDTPTLRLYKPLLVVFYGGGSRRQPCVTSFTCEMICQQTKTILMAVKGMARTSPSRKFETRLSHLPLLSEFDSSTTPTRWVTPKATTDITTTNTAMASPLAADLSYPWQLWQLYCSPESYPLSQTAQSLVESCMRDEEDAKGCNKNVMSHSNRYKT